MLETSKTHDRSTTASGLDGRTVMARRVRQLTGMYSAALGGALDALQKEAVVRAAELQAIAEGLRTRSLRGEAVDPQALIKTENAADRARRSLRIGNSPSPVARPIRDRLAAGGS